MDRKIIDYTVVKSQMETIERDVLLKINEWRLPVGGLTSCTWYDKPSFAQAMVKYEPLPSIETDVN